MPSLAPKAADVHMLATVSCVNCASHKPAGAGSGDSAGNTYRVYCSNGIKGDQDYLYRGWTCVPENSAAAPH